MHLFGLCIGLDFYYGFVAGGLLKRRKNDMKNSDKLFHDGYRRICLASNLFPRDTFDRNSIDGHPRYLDKVRS